MMAGCWCAPLRPSAALARSYGCTPQQGREGRKWSGRGPLRTLHTNRRGPSNFVSVVNAAAEVVPLDAESQRRAKKRRRRRGQVAAASGGTGEGNRGEGHTRRGQRVCDQQRCEMEG